MSNFQEPKKQFEIPFDTFADFLMVNGYVGKIEMNSKYTELKSETSYVRIPYVKTLTAQQVKDSLLTTKLTISDLEVYLNHLEGMKGLNYFVDRSKNTLA